MRCKASAQPEVVPACGEGGCELPAGHSCEGAAAMVPRRIPREEGARRRYKRRRFQPSLLGRGEPGLELPVW